MAELLQKEEVTLDSENDIVVFRVGGSVARFSYTSAFMIAQELRLCGNVAARIAGIPAAERRDMKRAPPGLEDVRAVGLEIGPLDDSRWKAWNEGALVAFRVRDWTARWEAPAAMTIAGWFRLRAREGKDWAGDTSKTLRLAGILTDANANARLRES